MGALLGLGGHSPQILADWEDELNETSRYLKSGRGADLGPMALPSKCAQGHLWVDWLKQGRPQGGDSSLLRAGLESRLTSNLMNAPPLG